MAVPALRLLAVLAVVLASPLALVAQVEAGPDWVVRRWTTQDGIPQNSANAILEARDGYLWLGTFGGVARFDGIDFEIFDIDAAPALNDGRILSFAEGPDGSIWVGTQSHGIVRRRGSDFETVVSADRAELVFRLFFDRDGFLWATSQNGVLVIDPGTGEVRSRDDLASVGFFGLERARDGAVIAATSSSISIVEPGLDGAVRPFAASPLARPPQAVLAHEDGSIDVTDGSILRRFSPEGTERFTAAMNAVMGESWRARSLVPGPDGSTFAGGTGLVQVDSVGRVVEIPLRVEGRPPRDLRAAMVDDHGTLWLGSRGDGLFQLRRSTLRPAVEVPTDELLEVYALGVDPRGHVWSSECSRLTTYESPDRARAVPGDAGRCLVDIESSEGEIWAINSIGNRAVRFDERGAVLDSIPGRFRILSKSLDGALWFLGPDRWAVRANGVTTFRNPLPEAAPDRALFFLPSGIWQAAGVGALRWDGPDATGAEWLPSLGSGDFRWFAEDERGVVWIATYGGGLIRVAGDESFAYGREQGLPDAFLSSAVLSGGFLWTHGNRFVMQIALDDLDAVASGRRSRLSPIVFGEEDGYAEASGAHAVVSGSGRVWFGTIDGPMVLDPTDLGADRTPPIPAIAEVTADGTVLPVGTPIPPLVREIEIRFTAPNFIRPERTRFRYRLLGLSDEWSEPTTRRSVFFTTLAPREYTFEVMSVTEAGVESTPVRIPLEVRPAVWQTWWFRLGSLLLIVGAISLVVRLITAAERKRSLALRKEIRARRKAEEEGEDLARRLLQAQKLEAVGRLTGGIAHDFNNLLLVITASLEMARDGVEDDSARQSIDTAMAAAFRGGALTRQMLAFSRRSDARRRPVEIARVVREMDQMLARSLGDPYPVRLHIAPESGSCVVDADGLQNVILNLAINARDAMPTGGAITVSVDRVEIDEPPTGTVGDARPGTYVRVSVVDRGTGIPDDQLSHVFDPFFTTKEVGKGTGLGLSMVHGFVGQHDGFVRIDTELDRGTTVSVHIPALDPSVLPTLASQEPDDRTMRPGRGERILLIEDNARVRDVTTNLLRSLGYVVEDAPDAETGRALLDARIPDLVLTDIMLPGESGVEFAVRIRKRYPDLPILLATGFAPEGMREAVHGFEILEKPYTGARLSEAVADALGAGRRSAPRD